jgi:hypothetical protein
MASAGHQLAGINGSVHCRASGFRVAAFGKSQTG